MAGISFGNKVSPLRMITTISVIAGLTCLSLSSLYLDAVIKLRNGQDFEDRCSSNATTTDDGLSYFCNELTDEWLTSGILGVVFSLVQMGTAVLGIFMIDYRWRIWAVINALLFLCMIFTFSWAAKYDVDDDIVEFIHPANTYKKGMAFLALVGLDFIFLFCATLFIFIFGRKNSGE